MSASVEELISSCGFESQGKLSASSLKVRQEVRALCSEDKCRSFNRNWSCPPACGSLEDWEEVFSRKAICYLAQTVAQLEDDFDFETMAEANDLNRERFIELNDKVHAEYPEAVLLSSGTCTTCRECTYPDSPCRFPERLMVSMEAAGLLVGDVCKDAGIPYNHGPQTICYTGCVLI